MLWLQGEPVLGKLAQRSGLGGKHAMTASRSPTTMKIHACAGLICAASLLTLSPAFAAAPAAAMNKTITISFNATGVAKSDDGQVKNFSTSVVRMIYVSTAGRLFMKHRATLGRNERGGEFDPNDARQGKGSFNFQGNRLVGVIPYANGARQITATFDESFSSCTASVIEGASGGTIRRKGPNGAWQTITSGSTTAPSCSVRSGNAFAGE
jgi:hypothetical protein